MKKILFAFACTATLSLAGPALASTPDGGSGTNSTNSLSGDEPLPGEPSGGCSTSGLTLGGTVPTIAILLGSAAVLAMARRRLNA